MSEAENHHTSEDVDDRAAAKHESPSVNATEASPTGGMASASAVEPATFSSLSESSNLAGDEQRNLDLVLRIPVTCSVELGRSKIPVASLLKLARGSVIPLDRMAGEPLDLLVNGCLIARGEVVVVNEKFGIRLLDIVERAERLKSVS